MLSCGAVRARGKGRLLSKQLAQQWRNILTPDYKTSGALGVIGNILRTMVTALEDNSNVITVHCQGLKFRQLGRFFLQ